MVKLVKRVQANQQLQSHYTEKELERFSHENFQHSCLQLFHMEILYEKLMQHVKFPKSEREHIEDLVVEFTTGV